MKCDGKRSWGCQKVLDLPYDPVSPKKAAGAWAAKDLRGTRPKTNPQIRELQRENQKLRDRATLLSQELMALKKR